MIMKKSVILSVLLVLGVFPLLFACSSSDDDNSVKNQLVGVWKTTITSSNWKVIQLEANGKLHFGMKLDEDGVPHYSELESSTYHEALWIYSEQDQIISLYSTDGYYSYTYKVSMSSDGKGWTGTPVSGSGSTKAVTFTRIEKAVQP